LPRLVGVPTALDMMLTGKRLRAQRAKRAGLVDMVVMPFGLRSTAVETCRRLLEGTLKRTTRRSQQSQSAKALEAALEDNAAGRMVLFGQARAQVMRKTKGLYPAPLAIVDVVETGLSKGLAAGYEAESKRFAELAMGSQARGLMHLFFAQTSLKKNRFHSGTPVHTTSLGVVGAGLMGAGIASVSVQQDIGVVLMDNTRAGLHRGLQTIWHDLDKRTQSRSITPFERERIAAKVVGVGEHRALARCDVVIEAVFENLALKHQVLQQIESHVHDDCVVATNTSALPIADIARASKRPHNVVGMHYFSPVQKMPLLEVVLGPQTSKKAAARAVQLGLQQQKTVIVVGDGPGFYTTRILGPVLEEAVIVAAEAVAQGMSLHDVDDAMTAWGFPVGPITLLDEVGLDVAAHVARDLQPFFAPRFGPPLMTPSPLDEMVRQGWLGKKSGRGFYAYEQRPDALHAAKKLLSRAPGLSSLQPPRAVNDDALKLLRNAFSLVGGRAGKPKIEDMQLRIGLRMVNEAVACLADGVLHNPVDGDIGAVFGLGFPPMTGGPFRYVDVVGASSVTGHLERFAQQHGPRFTPSPLLVEAARQGTKFHR
jgi:3-hydroxyacyl-CoA dehydrogenase